MILGLREQKILASIIDFHLKSGESVGSRTLAKLYDINLSPATIRNVMSDLEEFGYIEKVHSSSGRAPTNKGYKFYIDSLLEIQRISQRELLAIRKMKNLELSNSAKLLASMTSHTSFALEPNILRERLDKVELVYINSRSFLAVVVTGSSIKTKHITLTREIKEEDLRNLSFYLNSVFKGQILEDIEISSEVSPLRGETVLLQNFLTQIESNIHIEGSESVIDYLAKSNADLSSYRVFNAKEEMKSFLEALADKSEKDKVNIVLGDDLDSEKLKGLSFIFSTYNKGSSKGMIGIVGPKRMQYGKIAGVVEGVVNYFGKSSKGREDEES